MSVRDSKAAATARNACRLLLGIGMLIVPARVMAQDNAAAPAAAPAAEAPPPAPMAAPAPAPAPAAEAPAPAKPAKGIGGHIGIAVPLLMFDHPTKTIGDSDGRNIADPIGVTVKLNDTVAIDFEVVVATHINQGGAATTLTIDPGIIYNAGPVALGLRTKWDIGGPPNFGLIPLVNRGLVDFGYATWFVEAAFPTTYVNKNINFDVVFHTGLGF